MVFGLILKNLTEVRNDSIGKSFKRGAEEHKFQLHSTFQCGVMGTDTCLQFHCVPMVKVVTAVDFKCS